MPKVQNKKRATTKVTHIVDCGLLEVGQVLLFQKHQGLNFASFLNFSSATINSKGQIEFIFKGHLYASDS